MRLLPYVLLPALGLSAPSPVPQNPLGPDVKSTMLRFGCSQLVIDRIDPLVNPDVIPSPHLHQIAGGNAFNASMPYDTDISTLADCTTCSFSEDLSNYWTANLYFRARNGSYKRVPQAPVHSFGNLFNDDFTHASNAGFVVYYVSEKPGDVTAFKPGFRMFTGDANSREKRGEGFKNQTCFRCYTGPDFEGDIMAPCADPVLDYEGLPDKPCYGIRSNVLYPTCWDGKNLDSPDHKSHVAYPITGPHTFTALGTGGQCPESHPVRIPQLMLEIVWDTSGFNDPNEWPEDGSQPFVLSTGDTTGYGQHGDYVFGWKGDSLQRAMDGSCFGALCHALKSQSVEEAAKCKVPERVGEQVDGWLDSLPGMPEIYGKSEVLST